MKTRRRRLHKLRHALVTAAFASLPFLYWNCSKVGAPSSGSNGATNTVNALTHDGNGNYTAAPNTNGLVRPLQDIPFTLTLTGDSGPFTPSTPPSWAAFNSVSGVLSGIADKTYAPATIAIQGASHTYGAYTLYVQGNPLKEYQWHLKNTGQTAFALSAGLAGEDMHMGTTVTNRWTGAGVRVAISDSGVMLAHEALSANVLAGESRNYKNNYSVTHSWLGDPTPNFSNAEEAHGTAVASLALESGWNDVGGRGVAPGAKFAGFLYTQAQDQLGQNGYYDMATFDQFTGNFDIFNYSWTDPQCMLLEYPQTMFDTLQAAVTTQRGGKGSLHIMAAGNGYVDDIADCHDNVASANVFDNVNYSEIQTSPYVLNIAAVNANGVSSSYSSPGSAIWVSAAGGEYGWDTALNGYPEVSMPAMIAADFYGCSAGLKSLDAQNSSFNRGGAPNGNCRYTSTMNGTSSAAPVATGAVALMLQRNPNLTWRDVKYILAKTADKVNPGSNPIQHPDSSLNLSGHVYEMPWITNAAGFNFHNYYGFGRINVDKAMLMATGFVSPLGTFKESAWVDSGALNLAIPNASAAGLTRTLSVAASYKIEAVQLRVTTDDCAGDIGLELTSPSGTKSILMNINSRIRDGAIQNHIFLSNAFYGEQSSGIWTLKVVDGHSACASPHLTNWKLKIFGY